MAGEQRHRLRREVTPDLDHVPTEAELRALALEATVRPLDQCPIFRWGIGEVLVNATGRHSTWTAAAVFAVPPPRWPKGRDWEARLVIGQVVRRRAWWSWAVLARWRP